MHTLNLNIHYQHIENFIVSQEPRALQKPKSQNQELYKIPLDLKSWQPKGLTNIVHVHANVEHIRETVLQTTDFAAVSMNEHDKAMGSSGGT